jgi:hypothetical protein
VHISSTFKVGQKLGVSLPLLTCSPSAWPSRLLYRRGRKSRRDLWITLYIIKNRWDVTVKNKTECIVACVNIYPVYSSLWYLYRVNTVYINTCNNTPSFVFNNYISYIFNNTKADILWPYGPSETSAIIFNGSTDTVWQFVVFWVFL